MDLIKRISPITLLPVLILIIGIIIFIVLKATSPNPQPVTVKERVWRVKTIPARLQSLSPTLTLYGQVETPDMVKAAAPDNGRVTSVSVREGDPIHKGLVMLNLDPRDFEPKIIQAEARATELKAMIASEELRHLADQKAYRHERSLLKLEHAAVKRAEMMHQKKLGSTAAHELAQEELVKQQLAVTTRKLNLDDHQARLQQLQARLLYAEAELEMARLDLERSQIIAPFDGVVDKIEVSVGDQVKDNQILLSYYPLDKLEVRAKIPATFRNELQRGIIHGDTLSADAIIAGLPVTLELDRVAGSADSRGIDALFQITKGNDLVRPGSTLSLTLKRAVHEDAIAIPFSAIYDNNKIYKSVENRLQAVTVTQLGEFIDQGNEIMLLIKSPEIKNGDQIVVTHLPNAVSGLAVESM